MRRRRLWEIGPWYEAHSEGACTSLADLVALFDSAYLSFYKGLGALGGASELPSQRAILLTSPASREAAVLLPRLSIAHWDCQLPSPIAH